MSECKIKKMKTQLTLLTVLLLLFQSCTKSLQEIVKDNEKATFVVYTFDEFGAPSGSGSGFFIQKNGVGITNYHVLDKSVKALIKTNDGTYVIDSILASSKTKDIVIFKVKSSNKNDFSCIKISKVKPLKGSKVYNIGSPLGLESTVSEGIVSSFRNDEHGDIVQITAPISPGSSGSPIMNEKGDVFAVATFKRVGGENVNFGVIINDDVISTISENDLAINNPKLTSRNTEFIILNKSAEKGSELILNAVEFDQNATILYLTFTNLHLSDSGEWAIWCEIGKKDEGFYIEDKTNGQRFYITSSSLALDKANSTPIGLAKNRKFKVFFPPISNKLSDIDVIWGNEMRGSQFKNINLNKYRQEFIVDDNQYLREYALSCVTQNNDFNEASETLKTILQKKPSDAISLNALGIISYVLDNNNDALQYFSSAIDTNPNDELGYINRAKVYAFQKNFEFAIKDVTSAISLVPKQPDYYYERAIYYYSNKDYEKAKVDMNKCMEVAEEADAIRNNPYFYEVRAYVNLSTNDFEAAKSDIQIAYKLSSDDELDKRLKNLWDRLN